MKLSRPTALPILPFGVPDQGYSTMRVTSPFGWRDSNGDGKLDAFHGAVDIGNAREGDSIIAVADGRVIAAGYLKEPWSESTTLYPSGNYGGMMVVQELAPGVVAIYAHMQPTIFVKAGQVLRTGQLIGKVGATGSAQKGGAHLHFGIQAPISLVPAGVSTRATHFGLGLDVDPWPLISGQAELLGPADDMALKGKFLRHVHNKRAQLTTSSNFRRGVTSGDDAPWQVFPKGTVFYPFAVVEGRAVGTEPDAKEWYAALQWVGAEGGFCVGYYHSSVLPRSADQHSVALEPVETVQVVDQAAVQRALDDLNGRIDRYLAARPR